MRSRLAHFALRGERLAVARGFAFLGFSAIAVSARASQDPSASIPAGRILTPPTSATLHLWSANPVCCQDFAAERRERELAIHELARSLGAGRHDAGSIRHVTSAFLLPLSRSR